MKPSTPSRSGRVAALAAAATLPLLAAVAITSAVSPATAAAGEAPTAGGTYRIVGGQGGMCVEIKDHSTSNGAKAQQSACGAATATGQQFRAVASSGGRFNLVNVKSTRCLDVTGASSSPGVQLQQWGCGSGDKANQQWTFRGAGDGLYQIVGTNGLCVTGSSGADGGAVTQDTCGSGAGQQWAFQLPSGSTPTATPTSTGPRTWSDTPDGFAALPGLGRGPTTGGAGGQTVTVTNQADLNRYVTAAEPYIIKVAGTINISPKGTELRVSSNKTIVGVGTSGEIVGGGFFLKAGVNNVIIRNLTIRDTRMPDDDPGDDSYDYDAIQLDTADHIWIDHNRLTRMNDGLLDSRKDTTNLTVSWNQFFENNKTFGIGWTDNVTSQITIHHNWFQNTNSRNPSADNIGNLHMYNNHLQNITGYGNFVRGLTKAVIENSYYDTVKDPYYVEEGELVQRGNIVVNSTWGSGKVKEKGSAFDPKSFYSYTLDPAADVPALLRAYSGPQANIGT
ncbi:RICIN domain-containing protein [Nonomuraea sp. H19]|uniref:RICIN domain-containing protein n=1 Tax=Nonomuraea sp. H19 TaxID=3452206 RepID=UPI003F899AC7